MKTLRRISKNRAFTHARILAAVFLVVAAAALIFMSVSPPAAAQSTPRTQSLTPTFSKAVAFDVSPALRTLPLAKKFVADPSKLLEIRPERGPRARSRGYKSGDAALQALTAAVAIPSPLANFEGLSNQDNLNIFGFRVNPPDPNGEIGPNNYVEMINLVFAVYDRAGNLEAGPIDTGSLWADFAIPDCTDPSGDPVVLYDQLEDRWLLSPDIDGRTKPANDSPAPIIGTQDDDADYGATFDALNIWELSVKWKSNPTASINLKTQLPVAPFDSIFPCAPTSRDCLPQPGITDPTQYLDILSYRQRPTFRLAYRNFRTYESLVTNQSVEARPGVAGARWYEIRRSGGSYSVYQQGTYAPNAGVHRWMGSIAQDKNG